MSMREARDTSALPHVILCFEHWGRGGEGELAERGRGELKPCHVPKQLVQWLNINMDYLCKVIYIYRELYLHIREFKYLYIAIFVCTQMLEGYSDECCCEPKCFG